MPDLYASPQLQASIRAGQAPLWSDYLKTVGIGTTDVLAAVPAGTRYVAELTDTDLGESIASSSQYLQDVVHGWGEDLEAGLSEPARERLLAEFGSEEFWKHPASSIALKAARTTPSMAASVGATMFTGGGAPAFAMMAGVQGGLSATQTVDEMYRTVDSMSNAELMENPLYAQFRKDGLSERDARAQFNRISIGAKPAVLFAVGAATSLFGPEAMIARTLGAKGLGEGFRGGILKRTGKAMGAGAVSEAIETGAESLATEQGAVDVGFQSAINPYRVAAATAEGATLGGLFGTVGGLRGPTRPPVRSTTNANTRPESDNPPAAVIKSIVTPAPGPISMPGKGSNTQATPAIVPGRAGHTAPTSRVATVPGAKGDVFKKNKGARTDAIPLVEPAPATGTAAAPTPVVVPAPQVVAPAPPGDPGGLVTDSTQVAALAAQTAPTGLPAPPTPAPTQAVPTTPTPATAPARPRTTSQVQRDQGVGYAEAANIAEQEAAATAPAPTTPPTAPAPPSIPGAPAPGAGFGAGTIAAPVPPTQAVPTEAATPSAFGGVAQPVGPAPIEQAVPTTPVVVEPIAPTARGRRVLPAAITPEAAAQVEEAGIAQAREIERQIAPPKPTTGISKDVTRTEKRTRDAQVAQDFLNARPDDLTVPTTIDEHDTFVAELGSILTAARTAGVQFRQRVSGEKMPASLVWLREAETLHKKLVGGKRSAKQMQQDITEFLLREGDLKAGRVEEVKTTRKGEGEAAKRTQQKAVEAIAAPTQEPAPAEPETTERVKASDLEGKPQEGIVGKEDVETKVTGSKAGAVRGVSDRTEKRKVIGKGGKVEEVEGTEAASEGVSRKDLFAQYNAQLAAEAAAKAGAKPEPEPEPKIVRKWGGMTREQRAARDVILRAEIADNKARAEAEKLVSAAVRADGKLYTGPSHQKALPDLIARGAEVDPDDVGYVTTEGRFVGFDEALEIAQAAGQLKNPKTSFDSPNINFAKAPVAEIKAKTAEKKAAQEVKLPPKVKRKKLVTKEAPKPSGKAALAEELDKVEKAPSQAQIDADNARKGHVSIEGVPVSIDTAKNTERQGQTPTGRRWNWLYKFSHGHIPGTKGPDGTPIGIFLGPEAYPKNESLQNLPVVVIDQVDPVTKAPDEPKVMFGFKQITDAVKAYEESYPDGAARRGDVVPMSLDEFKAWLKTKSDAEPAGVPVSEVDVAVVEAVDTVVTDPAARRMSLKQWLATPLDTPAQAMDRRVEAYQQNAVEREKIAAAFATMTGKVSDFLDINLEAIRGSFLDKISKAIFPRFAKRVRELAGDVQVYVVPDDVFINQIRQPRTAGAVYSVGGDYILVRESEVLDDVNFASLVLHEATHAAFIKAVYSNPKMIAQLERILKEARVASGWSGSPFDMSSEYGLSNIDELVAEAFSNQSFQEILLNIKASNALIKELGLDGKFKSLWDVLVRWMGKVLGFGKAHDTLFAAVMKVSGRLSLEAPNLQGPASSLVVKNYLQRQDTDRQAANLGSLTIDPAFRIPERINERLPSRVRQAPQQIQVGDPWLLGARTMDQLVQLAKGFGTNFYKHLRTAADTIERIRVSADNYLNQSMPIIRELHALERKYKGTGQWQAFTDLVMDETSVGVFADRPLPQKHLGKDTLRGIYPKARHADLHAQWQALPQDLKDARLKAMNFFTEQQNLEKIGIIRNTLKVAGFPDPDLAQRLFDGDETDADIELLGRTYDHIKDASELAKIKGPYFPQMRRGNQVVRALYKITAPTNALRQIDDNTWEFAGKQARKQAAAFAAAQDHMKPTVSSVWVDTNTGERYFNLNQPDEVRVKPQDVDSEQRFRVSIQNRYVEFFESKREAFEVADELRRNPAVESVQDAVERRFNANDRQADMLSHQMQVLASSLERRPGYQNLSPNQQNQVVQAFNTASLRLLSQTRIQTKRLPRTNVLGASRDLTRNTLEYAQSVSGYLARLDHQDELSNSMRDARAEADSSGDYGKGHGQSVLMNEMERRVARSTAFEERGTVNDWINRTLAVSFADKLISPAYNLLNSLQPIMMTYPALAARYGPGRAAVMLARVYKDIGVGQALKGGLVASKRTLMQGPSAVTPSILDDIRSNIKSSKERSMIDYLVSVGSIDVDAGIEISNMIETRTGVVGGLDQGINYLQTFGRQMPRSIEAINRTVTALAAYRLEMSRSGDHDASVRFAQETTNATQGLYSHSNAAPIFNHPLGKISFQFKKYGQLVYGLIGHNIGKAIRNAEPGDRAEAVKTLAYMAATHVVLAGALGLPTEPLKWLFIGAKQAGLTELNWADVENYEREILASVFGQQLGEIAARGVSRALPEGFAFDMSSRVGLQDLFTFGEPRSADKQDLSAFLWDTAAGAPVNLVGDWFRGAQAVLNGEWGEAAERFTPVKVVADAIKSYRTTSEGKKTAAGYESLSPYSLGEAAIRTFGLTPAREAETSEARNYFYSATKRASAERNSLMQDWYQASSSVRGRMWGQIEAFNRGKARDEKLTRSELDKYAKRRRSEERTGLVKSGFRVTRREQNQYKKLQNTYNVSP